ncbi:MAG: hypothetical protein GQ563_05110 [Desulfuromusa sp.]|nr:hypothetical protein [Desulfuromusa sp.]
MTRSSGSPTPCITPATNECSGLILTTTFGAGESAAQTGENRQPKIKQKEYMIFITNPDPDKDEWVDFFVML